MILRLRSGTSVAAYELKGWSCSMRGTITLDHHDQHAWFHFAIRFFIVALLIFLLLVLTEKAIG